MDWSWMKGAGTLIGGIGQAYGAVKSAEALKDDNDLSKQKFNLDKEDYERNISKEDSMQFN